jgi:transcriptional regulator GlxA family with amidase domain
VSSLGAADVARLRALAAAAPSLEPGRWVSELAGQLKALGAPGPAVGPRAIAPAPAPLERLYTALGRALSRLGAQPSLAELAEGLGVGERQVHRGFAELARAYAHPFEGWRDFLHQMRVDWAAQLLSVRGLSLGRVAELAGYRSTTALFHAFSARGAATPGAIARRLAEHWR